MRFIFCSSLHNILSWFISVYLSLSNCWSSITLMAWLKTQTLEESTLVLSIFFFSSGCVKSERITIKGLRAQQEVVLMLMSMKAHILLIIIPKFQLQIHYTLDGTEENISNYWYTNFDFLMYLHNRVSSIFQRVIFPNGFYSERFLFCRVIIMKFCFSKDHYSKDF